MAKFTFIDLFAGIGGFRMALESVGGQCVGFSEIAPDAISTYCLNYHEDSHANLGDITKIQSLPAHNFLTGGVPCQSWSIAGKNLGFDDSRGQLWNDALYLLSVSKPDVFIFENVKGLADPRNISALSFIMSTIREVGYFAEYFLLNAYDYGVPQNRIRIYIIGFKEKKFFDRFSLPVKHPANSILSEIICNEKDVSLERISQEAGKQSMSANSNGLNDYFLFNDLRSGSTTIHSWDLIETNAKEKSICMLLLQNRRKRIYGHLDGNPLSLRHFQALDPNITQSDIDGLILKGILKEERYIYQVSPEVLNYDEPWVKILSKYHLSEINIDILKSDREFKIAKINISSLLEHLCTSGLACCIEIRYDFKNTKISTGLNGINRIFLPSSRIYPTLVASDTNDYITDVFIDGKTPDIYKANFLREVYLKGRYRQISKEEACSIQGFPRDFILPNSRARWMKLIGNSVAVTLIRQLAQSVVNTGVFDERDYIQNSSLNNQSFQMSLF